VPATVLIAAAEHLATLKEREELVDAVMFSDAEALRALDVITRQRPDIVLLDRQFAGTSRGAALINRIKADPSLGACEIRIVEDDRSFDTFTETGASYMGFAPSALLACTANPAWLARKIPMMRA